MSKVYLFPIAAFIVCQGTIISVVLSLYLKGSLHSFYISDGAQNAPESCIFGQLINVYSILLGIIIYIRYRQIEDLLLNHYDIERSVRTHNEIAFWMGESACIGSSIAANFQQSNVPIVHAIGGYVYFCFGIIYVWNHGIISYYSHQYTGSQYITEFRLILAFFYTFLLFMALITSCNIVQSIEAKNCLEYYALSVSSEWIAVTLFNIYILTFSSDFKLFSFDRPKLIYGDETNE